MTPEGAVLHYISYHKVLPLRSVLSHSFTQGLIRPQHT